MLATGGSSGQTVPTSDVYTRHNMGNALPIGLSSCEVKQAAWLLQQRTELQRRGVQFFELLYESLADHPQWKSSSSRKHFSQKQTE